MRPLPIVCAFALATIGASAEHCTVNDGHLPEVDSGGSALGRFYVDNDLCQPGCMFSIWVYQESNGIEGLQRGDPVRNDTCHGTIRADSIVLGGTGIAL